MFLIKILIGVVICSLFSSPYFNCILLSIVCFLIWKVASSPHAPSRSQRYLLFMHLYESETVAIIKLVVYNFLIRKKKFNWSSKLIYERYNCFIYHIWNHLLFENVVLDNHWSIDSWRYQRGIKKKKNFPSVSLTNTYSYSSRSSAWHFFLHNTIIAIFTRIHAALVWHGILRGKHWGLQNITWLQLSLKKEKKKKKDIHTTVAVKIFLKSRMKNWKWKIKKCEKIKKINTVKFFFIKSEEKV